MHYHDQISKIIVNLGSTKGDRHYYSSPKLTYLQNLLLNIIVGTPEKGVSQSEGNKLTTKVSTSFITVLFFVIFMFNSSYV